MKDIEKRKAERQKGRGNGPRGINIDILRKGKYPYRKRRKEREMVSELIHE